MSKRKPILYLLLSVVGVILVYNYMIAPVLMQYNNRMGMGMHWRMYNNYNYFIDMRYILIILVIIAGFILFDLIKPKTEVDRCSKCGNPIESNRWKICPKCGTPVKDGRGGNG